MPNYIWIEIGILLGFAIYIVFFGIIYSTLNALRKNKERKKIEKTLEILSEELKTKVKNIHPMEEKRE